MITKGTVAKRIEKILKQKGFFIESLEGSYNKNYSLSKDYGMDSIDIVDFIMELESEFKISISDDEMEKLFTIGNVITYVSEKLNHKH